MIGRGEKDDPDLESLTEEYITTNMTTREFEDRAECIMVRGFDPAELSRGELLFEQMRETLHDAENDGFSLHDMEWVFPEDDYRELKAELSSTIRYYPGGGTVSVYGIDVRRDRDADTPRLRLSDRESRLLDLPSY